MALGPLGHYAFLHRTILEQETDLSLQTQDANWTYLRRSEDILDVFWTSYVRLIYVLCLWGYQILKSRERKKLILQK